MLLAGSLDAQGNLERWGAFSAEPEDSFLDHVNLKEEIAAAARGAVLDSRAIKEQKYKNRLLTHVKRTKVCWLGLGCSITCYSQGVALG